MNTSIKCPACGAQFNSQQELDEHTKKAHGSETGEEKQEHAIICSKCGMRVKSKEELEQHEQQHSGQTD